MRAETACWGPLGEAETRSHTSRMYSQFSLTRFSSVALTVRDGRQHGWHGRERRFNVAAWAAWRARSGDEECGLDGRGLTDGIVHGIRLCAKHVECSASSAIARRVLGEGRRWKRCGIEVDASDMRELEVGYM